MKLIPVFVYETLQNHGIQIEALGHTKEGVPVTLQHWKEVHSGDWPTIKQSSKGSVRGEIIRVTPEELTKLDKWEDTYRRFLLHTPKGKAWVYLHMGD